MREEPGPLRERFREQIRRERAAASVQAYAARCAAGQAALREQEVLVRDLGLTPERFEQARLCEIP